MPNGGSENQIESSDLTDTSFGELRRLPSKRSISTVIDPSYSVRVIRRVSCSPLVRRPWRAGVVPFACFEGLRYATTPPGCSFHPITELLGISLQLRQRASPNHAGPSPQHMA